MKKVYLFFAMVASMLFFASCQNEMEHPSLSDGEVTFTVTLPESIQTKAISDGLSATELTYAVYNVPADGQTVTEYLPLRGTATFPQGSLSTTITVKFVKGNHYQMVFWAQSPEAIRNGVYDISDLRSVKVNYDNATSNDEYRDAFYAYVPPFQVTQSFSQNVTLHRPFAQINFGTADLDYAASAGFDLASTQSMVVIESQVATTLNTFDGTVADPVDEVIFSYANIPAEKILNLDRTGDLVLDNKTYDYIATNYILVNDESTGSEKDLLNNITLTFKTVEGESSMSAVNIPVQRNHRTNLLGDLLTTDGDFIVTIDPIYEEPDYFVDVWNGSQISEPTLTAEGYVITTPAELAWFQSNPIDHNLLIAADLDFNGFEFRSLRYWNPEKRITIEGLPLSKSGTRNPVIRNFKGENGLFSTATADFKNIDFENIEISAESNFVGVVCGNLYGSVENIKVSNSSIIANSEKTIIRIGGLVGIHNAGNAKGCTIDNVQISGVYHNAGGISGTVNETDNREYTDCHAYNSNISIRCTEGSGASMVGAISGNANGVKLVLNGCSFDEKTVPQVLVGAGSWSDGSVATFEVSPLEIALEDVAETQVEINVTGNVAWTAVCDELLSEPVNGEGEQTITLTIPENTLEEEVVYNVVISTQADVETQEYIVLISQPAAESQITDIADVQYDGTYTVQGVVAAVSTKGFVLADQTGAIFYYNSSYSEEYSIGQELTLTGKVGAYGTGLQFTSDAVIVEGEFVGMDYPQAIIADATIIDEFIADTNNKFAQYVELNGTLNISGNYYNIVVEGTSNQASLYYTPAEIKDQLAQANGAKVKIIGYAISVSSGRYYNIVVNEVEIVEMPQPEEPKSYVYEWDLVSGDMDNGAAQVVKGTPELTWNASYTWKTGNGFFGWDTNNGKGVQIGSGSKPATAFSLQTTTPADMNVSSIVINTSGANSIAGTVDLYVNDVKVGETVTLTNAATEYEFVLDAAVAGSSDIRFEYSQTSSKAIYIKHIKFAYDGSEVEGGNEGGEEEDPFADYPEAEFYSFSPYSDTYSSIIVKWEGNSHLIELNHPSSDTIPEGEYTFGGSTYSITSDSGAYAGWSIDNFRSGTVIINHNANGTITMAVDLTTYGGVSYKYKSVLTI